MLNKDALDQLRALKQQISHDQQREQEQREASKVRATGTVRGTQGRYGFVVQDDGRELYLPAEQMLRVFPDDRVQVEVIEGSNGKTSAVVEKLLASPLAEFTGRYLVRDNAHFIEPDLPRLSRWLFVPPKQRGGAAHGDLVRGRISRHPLADGRPQARVEQVIGRPETPGIEQRYALIRFGLEDTATACDEQQLLQPDPLLRDDLTALPFLTIDGADTQDMDDALHAEARDGGWRLWVAIADPSAWIAPGSALDQAVAERASAVYLPGHTVAMLPEALANQRCSLQPDADRLALVCAIEVDAEGNIESYRFSEATIRSRAKLSYAFAAAALAGDAPETAHGAGLRELHALAQALHAQRRRDHVLMPDRPDYPLQLDERGKIAAIQRQDKTAAHQLVEECMVAANRCAAEFLQHDAAIFIGHNGFRPERRETVAKLLAEHLPQAAADVGELPGYIQALRACAGEHPLPLRAILSRSLERSALRTQAAPHFGMGLPRYTTITSPIRKYSDFLLHRLIKAKLQGLPTPAFEQAQLDHIQDRTDRARQAAQLAEQWLKCQYLEQLPKGPLRGEVCHVTSSGFVVRLHDTGIEGFVDTRHSGVKCSFDATTLRLTCGGWVFQLEQPVEVEVATIDMKKRSISFKLPQQTGAEAAADHASSK